MNHHRPTTCFLLTACLLAVSVSAQTPQRTDIGALLDQMPKLPATTLDARTMHANDRYLPYADQMNGLLEKTKQLNPITVRVQKQAVATDTKFKADGVDKMSGTEKMEYAKQQNLGGPGMTNRIDFAQKMQDPTFRSAFEAMTPQQKMALMQQQGVTPTPAAMPQTSNPMQADMVAMMQDPAMREKWKNMSPAEKQAFIDQQKKARGYDASKRPTQSQTAASGGFSDMPNSPAPATPASAAAADAIAKTRALQTALTDLAKRVKAMADQQQQQNEQAMADMQKAIQEAGKKQTAEGIAEARRQGKSGVMWLLTNPAEDHRIRLTALQQQQRTDNATLATATTEWTQRQAVLKKLVADYQVAMTAIQYGESLFKDDTQFQNVATLTGQQSLVFSLLQDLDQTFGKIAGQAAKTQDLVADESKLTIGPRQFMPAAGG